ncbi:HTH_Tnp_Tc3_2 domain-containing protein [Trichonephila clavipes]|nr:HTH_Tnp_Tc3_2 domain-containing protein [Trichonephila clavipes]
MSFTRRPDSGHPRQTSRREDRHIVRNVHAQPTGSSAAIQAQVAPSLGALVSSRNIRRHLAERHLGSRCTLRMRDNYKKRKYSVLNYVPLESDTSILLIILKFNFPAFF